MTERSTSAGVVHGPPPLRFREELAAIARMAHLADRVGIAFLMSLVFVGWGVFSTAFQLRVMFDHDAALLVVCATGIFVLMASILLFSPRSMLILAVWLLALAGGGFTTLYYHQPRVPFLLLGIAATSTASLVGSAIACFFYWRLKVTLRESQLSWSECRRLAKYWFAFGGRGWPSPQFWPRPWLATPEKTVQVTFTLHEEEMIDFVGRDRDFGSNMWFSGRDPANFIPCPAEAGRAAFVITFTDTTGTLLVSADEGEVIRAWVERRFPPGEVLSTSGYLEFRSMALVNARKAVSTKA